jgi:hypothetical protein
MYIYRIILWFLITLFSLNLIYLILKKTEGFQDADPEQTLKTEVNGLVTRANDTLCPIYKELLQNRVDANLTNKESNIANKCLAKSKAIESINKETNNLLFPCPPPTDPMLVPNNIDQYIEKTTLLLNNFLDSLKKSIQESLSCPKKEGFQDGSDMPDDSQCAAVNAAAKKEEVKAQEVKMEDPALKQQRIQALQLKSDALKKGLINPLFISLIDKYNELKEIKRKAESGELKPNCSS